MLAVKKWRSLNNRGDQKWTHFLHLAKALLAVTNQWSYLLSALFFWDHLHLDSPRWRCYPCSSPLVKRQPMWCNTTLFKFSLPHLFVFILVHPECFFIRSNMWCHKLVPNWFFNFDFCSNHISQASVVVLKTFDTSISIQTLTSLLLCTHILTFSWPLNLGNFISVFFFSASGRYMDISIVLSLSFTLCVCVAI